MTQRNRNLAYGASATALLGLSFLGWTHQATAQNDPAQQPPRGGGRMMMGGGGATIAASGDSVFVLRGNTVWKLKASDLSVDAQKELPAPPRPADGWRPRRPTNHL